MAYRGGLTEIVKQSGASAEQVALAESIEAQQLDPHPYARAGAFGTTVQARTLAVDEKVASDKAKVLSTTGLLAALAAGAAALFGPSAAAAPAAGAGAVEAGAVMPPAIAPSGAGFTASSFVSASGVPATVYSLVDAAVAAPSFGAAAMNFSDILRTAAKNAVQGFTTNVFSGALGSAPRNGSAVPGFGGPVQMAGLGPWEFIPGITGPIYPQQQQRAPMQVQEAGIGGALARLIPGAGIVAGAAGVVRSVGGKILRVIMPGGRAVSRKRAVELAKRVGIDAAAVALGITAVDMAQMVLDDTSTKRRGRSITSAQLRTTRSTMRRVRAMHRQIVGYCGTAGYRRRSSGKRSKGLQGPIIVNQD